MFVPIETEKSFLVNGAPHVGGGMDFANASMRLIQVLPCITSKKWMLVWKRLTRNQALKKMEEYRPFRPIITNVDEALRSWVYYTITPASPERDLPHPIFLWEPDHIDKLVSKIVDNANEFPCSLSAYKRSVAMKAAYQACYAGFPIFS